MTLRSNTELFIAKAKSIHGSKYDYSKTTYCGSAKKLIIICLIHGEFEPIARNHLRGHDCPQCGLLIRTQSRTSNTKEFIDRAKKRHGDKYDYSKTIYTGIRNKLTIICKLHGEFEQDAANHLNGTNCPMCRYSKAELAVEDYLKEHNYTYKSQVKFNDCKGARQRLPFDFQITLKNDLKILIEIDGDQHRKVIFSQKSFDIVQIDDAIKNSYCLTRNLTLVRLEHTISMPKKSQIPHVIRQLETVLTRYESFN